MVINREVKEITFTIDTKNNRYYFGCGLFYIFYTKVNRNNMHNYSCHFIGKELKK